MENKNTFRYLRPADRVVIPKSEFNLVQHHGIYAGIDAQGQQWFLENNWKTGVQFTRLKEFLLNVPSDKIKIEPFEGNESQRTAALLRAKSKLGKKYNLFLYNCEHYCNEVQSGQLKSVQIIAALILAAIVFLVISISNSHRS